MNNDRFKFRVFDKEDGYYIPNSEVWLYPNGEIWGEWGQYKGDRFVIEQCTGLCDKNEKLIYENDIVRAKVYDKTYFTGCVVWKDCAFWLKREQNRQFIALKELKDWGCYLEIIGNVHEGVKNEDRTGGC